MPADELTALERQVDRGDVVAQPYVEVYEQAHRDHLGGLGAAGSSAGTVATSSSGGAPAPSARGGVGPSERSRDSAGWGRGVGGF